MRNSILSLEDMDQEDTDVVSATDVGAPTLDEARVIDADIESEADQLSEAAGIDAALERSESVLEAGVESGEGVSGDTAETIDAALEHFQNRLGISSKRHIRLSQESFAGDKESRLAATKASLEEINVLRRRLGGKVESSLESMTDGYAKALKTRKGIHDGRLMPALKAAHDYSWTAGSDSGKKVKISELGNLGDNATADDVLKRLKLVDAAVRKCDFVGILKEATTDLTKLARAIGSDNPEATISSVSIEPKLSKASQALIALETSYGSGTSEVAYPESGKAKAIASTLQSMAELDAQILNGWEDLVKASDLVREEIKKNPNIKGDQWRWAGRVIGAYFGLLIPGFIIGWMVDNKRNKRLGAEAGMKKTGADGHQTPIQKASESSALLQHAIQGGVDYLSKTAD